MPLRPWQLFKCSGDLKVRWQMHHNTGQRARHRRKKHSLLLRAAKIAFKAGEAATRHFGFDECCGRRGRLVCGAQSARRPFINNLYSMRDNLKIVLLLSPGTFCRAGIYLCWKCRIKNGQDRAHVGFVNEPFSCTATLWSSFCPRNNRNTEKIMRTHIYVHLFRFEWPALSRAHIHRQQQQLRREAFA